MKQDEKTKLKADIAAAEERGDWRTAMELKSYWMADLVVEGGADGRSASQRDEMIEAVAAAKTVPDKKGKDGKPPPVELERN